MIAKQNLDRWHEICTRKTVISARFASYSILFMHKKLYVMNIQNIDVHTHFCQYFKIQNNYIIGTFYSNHIMITQTYFLKLSNYESGL